MTVQGIQFKAHSKGRWELVSNLPMMGYIIPAGFVTDFRTTPDWLEWFVRLIVPKFHLSYVLHDYLYKYQVEHRKKADQIQWQHQSDFNLFQKCFVWFFVRTFGNHYYVKYLVENNKIIVKQWPWMFWAVDMVLNAGTIVTRRKPHVYLFTYQFNQIIKGQRHWYMKPNQREHWRFLHEFDHLMNARKGYWILRYIFCFYWIEKSADKFANKHINSTPKQIKKLWESSLT